MELLGDRPRVDVLVGVLPGDRAADDVAPRVATRLLGREALGFEFLEDVRHVLELDPVELDGLAGRPVAVRRAELRIVDRTAGVLVGDLRDRAKLAGFEDAVRRPDAHHEVALLALPLVVQPPPLEALEPRVLLLLGDGVPPLLGEPEEVLPDFVTVDLVFPSLDVRGHIEAYSASTLTKACLVSRFPAAVR